MSLQEKLLSIQGIITLVTKIVCFAEKLVEFILSQTQKA